MRLLAWDPGLRESGAALFVDGKLVEAMAVYANTFGDGPGQWRAMVDAVAARFARVDVFAFEQMQTRKGMSSAHSNLIELSIMAGMVSGRLWNAKTVAVPANTWTKGRKKHVNASIINRILDDEEADVLKSALDQTAKANHKEITDAVGIGLYVLKRWM